MSAVKIDLGRSDGIAVITIDDGKVNIMTEQVWLDLTAALTQAESAHPRTRAVLFRSGLKKPVFTAGNDITRLYAPNTNVAEYAEFWQAQNVFLSRLAGSPLVTACAIKGACPAGGCALAICCDFRFASRDVTMGLNEARIGISVPGMWQIQMAHVLSDPHAAERLCSLGNMVNTEYAAPVSKVRQQALLGIYEVDSTATIADAASAASGAPAVAATNPTTESRVFGGIGLLDAIYDDIKSCEAAAITTVRNILRDVPDPGRVLGKMQARGAHVREWGDRQRIQREAEDKWPFLASKPVVDALGATLARLQGNKGKKAAPSSPKI